MLKNQSVYYFISHVEPSDVSIGVPCVLGKSGVEKILELKLDPETKMEFEKNEDGGRKKPNHQNPKRKMGKDEIDGGVS